MAYSIRFTVRDASTYARPDGGRSSKWEVGYMSPTSGRWVKHSTHRTRSEARKVAREINAGVR